MKILQICAYAAEYEGNFMKSLYELEKELCNDGYETVYAFPVSAINLDWVKKLEKTNKIYFLPLSNARINPATYIKVRNILVKENIDIVHSHFELYDLPISMMAPKNVKIFWHLHDAIFDNESKKNRLLRLIQYRFFNKNSTMVSVAEFYRKKAVELGMPEKQTITLLNCLDLNRLEKDNWKKENKPYDFLILGWDFHRKGGDLVLDACERLYQKGYNFKLLFNGNDKTWPYLESCINSKNPEWLELGKPIENVNELYGQCKSLISASRKETFSYAVCEAVYCGLPVISSDIAGLEWTKNIKSVFMFDSENVDQLVENMKTLLKNSFKLEENVIIESQTMIENEYSIESWVKKLISIYGV